MNQNVEVTLPDGSIKEVQKGTTILDVARGISEGLARVIVGAKWNGELTDLSETLESDGHLALLKVDEEDGKHFFWHTSAHLLAHAIQNLFPDTKFAIGPAIKEGFYYDVETEHRFTPEDLEKLETEMKKLAKQNFAMEKEILTREAALELFREKGEDYKVELIQDLPEDAEISIYRQGDFIDLCKGPHLLGTKRIKAIKLMSIAGAYWRGDENRTMLQRIYGITFEKKKELDAYLERIEEAKKRDHRRLGKELGLFVMHKEGPGFPFFLPKGMVIRNLLQDLWKREHILRGYGEIMTPLILNEDLWHTSGHWDHYQDNMYFTKIDEEDYAIKPMNCPGSMLAYKSGRYSYRDLPLRLGELGLVHRHEAAGALHGLFRVRSFTQDDAHIFMTPDQIKDEIKGVMKFVDEIYAIFGFKYNVEVSTRPEDSMGTDEEWEHATASLVSALDEMEQPYTLNEGDGAFYGPKIDIHLEDAIGRTWQCGTVQLDFQMPQRFELSYVGADNQKHVPIMIHRVLFGSIERFIGILIEHYAGKFPVWLSPVQVSVLPISDKYNAYAQEVMTSLQRAGVRVDMDQRTEKIGYKIREAQLQKTPYMIIVGEKEVESKQVAIRNRDEGDLGAMELNDFIARIHEEVEKYQ